MSILGTHQLKAINMKPAYEREKKMQDRHEGMNQIGQQVSVLDSGKENERRNRSSS